jgi:hypothetical protein
MADRRTRRRLALAGGIACACACIVPCRVFAADDVEPPRPHALADFMSGARALLQDGTSRLEALFQDRFQALSRDTPDWLREQTRDGFDSDAPTAIDSLQLVVQQDRRDGTDLLTLRYPLMALGDLRTYAGAGINQAEYYFDAGTDVGPDVISRRNRHRSVGGAAELGAELQLSQRVKVNADLRWVDLDPQATLLRANDGLVGADPFSVGVSLGWRFR